MAKPIKATPTLRGKEAVRFLKEVQKESEHPSKERVALIKEAMQTKFNILTHE